MNVILGDGERLTIDVKDQSAAGTYVCVGDALGVKCAHFSINLYMFILTVCTICLGFQQVRHSTT